MSVAQSSAAAATAAAAVHAWLCTDLHGSNRMCQPCPNPGRRAASSTVAAAFITRQAAKEASNSCDCSEDLYIMSADGLLMRCALPARTELLMLRHGLPWPATTILAVIPLHCHMQLQGLCSLLWSVSACVS